MRLSHWLALRRNRAVWSDPVRRFRTLQSFAETEEDGGKDLRAAALRIADPDLRGHIERHANDEKRHASLFRRRAAEVAEQTAGRHHAADGASDRSYDLTRKRGADMDAHGFFNAGLFDELGEVAYVAMLHVAEQRAAEVFDVHSALNQDDPETKAVFDEILKDEKYHIAYTGKFLDSWRAEGRGREVERGLKDARSSRLLDAWKRLGVRSAGGFSRVVLRVLYWTLLVPFGLLARRTRDASGWRTARSNAAGAGYGEY